MGEIIGINTGSFDDDTEFEPVDVGKIRNESKDVLFYDINVKENQANYKCQKNFNCAIDINHQVIKAWALKDRSIFL